jgi:LacI family transcriptional regulator
MTKLTMKEVALHAGVALSSVSRVLNNHDDVSEKMRKKVLEACEELGYVPNLLASSLRSGTTKTVGFLISDISNPLYGDIAWGAERTLDLSGYAMILANSESDPRRDIEMIRLLKQRRVDGLILTVADDQSKEIYHELSKVQVPIVLIDREVSEMPELSAILSDHSNGMRIAVEHLIKMNHKRIALITGPDSLRVNRERAIGFEAAFKTNEPKYDNLLSCHTRYSPEEGMHTTHSLLEDPNPPSAIICGGNLLLIGVLRALKQKNLKVGEDISLISCDDVPLTELHTPPISVIARDTSKMGESAASVLVNQMNSPTPVSRIIELPTTFHIRESVRPLN